MRVSKRKGWALALVAIMALVLLAPATAQAAGETYTVTASSLNVRSGPSTNTSVIGSLKNGAQVTINSVSGAWGSITYNGRTGYIHMDYVRLSGGGSSTASGTGTITGTNVNFRTGPSTGTSSIMKFPKGATVTILGTAGSWTQVSYNGRTGYVSSQYVRANGGTTAPTQAPTTGTTPTGQAGTIAGTNVNFRSGPATSYSSLGKFPNGASVSVLGQSGAWYQVSYNGRTGYVHGDYLRITTGGGGSTAPTQAPPAAEGIGVGIVRASSLNVRSGPGTGYSRVGSLPNGASVTVLSQSGGWYQIRYNSLTGYVSGDYLSYTSNGASTPTQSPSGSIGTGVVTASALNMRSGPGTGYSRITTLPNGATVTVLAQSGGWYQVSYGGKTGYVSGEYIRFTPATQPTQTPTAVPTEDPGSGGSTIGTSNRLAGKTIIVDAGHGGSESGAYYGGIQEKIGNLAIAIKVRDALQRSGATVVMTRSGDSTVDLYDRTSIVNKLSLETLIGKRQDEKAQLTQQQTTLAQEVEKLEQAVEQLSSTDQALSAMNTAIAGNADYQAAIRTAQNKADALLEAVKPTPSPTADPTPSASPAATQPSDAPATSPTPVATEPAATQEAGQPTPTNEQGATPTPAVDNLPTSGEQQPPDSSLTLHDRLVRAAQEQVKGYGVNSGSAAYDALYAEALYVAAKANGVQGTAFSELQAAVSAMKSAVTEPFGLDDLKNVSTAKADKQQELTAKQQELAPIQGRLTTLEAELTDMQRVHALFAGHLNGSIARADIYGSRSNRIKADLEKTFKWQEELKDSFMFVSIHANATADGSATANGTEVYYVGSGTNNADTYFGAYDTAARARLASLLLSEVSSGVGTAKRYTSQVESYCVLREQNLVSALVEVGFLSNPGDRSKITNPVYQQKAADAIVRGIMAYYGV